ncbi:4'-phosphopantetheinyl transferase superfamily protein [Flavobacteriaceae bacterium R38]|nr:4'-phosphopantetheinyl transferase superfamily protein [Flavobacteriaceae bacterium R38]
MPLYKSITVNHHTKVLIWRIEESEEKLNEDINLTLHCKERIASMKSELHRRGFLSVRQLLKVAGYEASDLNYDTEGRPHLSDKKKISITHSFQFSAIIISDEIVGIDIEKQRSKIKNIASKFTEDEFAFISEDDEIEMLTYIWCIKESLYKAYATAGISFKEHIRITPFSLNDVSGKACVDHKGKKENYQVYFLTFDGFSCAYALKI